MEELELDSSQPVLLTPEGYARLQSELTRLTVEKRAEIAERIRASKDHGEFSEDNSELEEVKIEQAIVESRITDLKTIFANAEVLESKDIPVDHVGLGSRVTVHDVERGFEFEVRLVASVEANPDEDLISEESPMGQALFGKKIADTVVFEAPVGQIHYRIEKIAR